MIAHALAAGPELLIADEPTTALDVTVQAQVVELLLRLRAARGLAILFISHDLALVSQVADRILVMYGGLVMEQGPAATVLDEPRHPYTRALLEAHLELGVHYTDRPLRTIPGTVPGSPASGAGLPVRAALPLGTGEVQQRRATARDPGRLHHGRTRRSDSRCRPRPLPANGRRTERVDSPHAGARHALRRLPTQPHVRPFSREATQPSPPSDTPSANLPSLRLSLPPGTRPQLLPTPATVANHARHRHHCGALRHTLDAPAPL